MLLLITTLFVLGRLVYVHYHLLTFPYQNEYREGASLLFTQALATGVDPYARANQPLYTHVYGFVANLIAAPFALVMGPSLPVERLLAAFYTLLALALFYAVLRRLGASILLRIVTAVMMYAAFMEQGKGLVARPDALGWLLFLASVCLPWLDGWSRRSLLASAVLALVAFYTKSYFILGGAYVGLCLFLFVSKRKALFYAIASGALLLASVLIVNQIADLYFSNAFFNHINNAGDNANHLARQINEFLAYWGWFLLVPLLAFGLLALRHTPFPLRLRAPRFDIRHLDQPLWRHGNAPLALFGLSLLVSLALLYWKLGKHSGAYMIYFHQLASPFLVLVATGALVKLERRQPPRLLVTLLLIPAVWNVTGFSNWQMLTRSHDLSGWQRVESLIAGEASILNSPPAASLMINYGKPLYDSGQTQYFRLGYDDYNVGRQFRDYRRSVTQMVDRREFDAILLTPGRTPLFDMDEVRRNYVHSETVILNMPYTEQIWETEIWLPRDGGGRYPRRVP